MPSDKPVWEQCGWTKSRFFTFLKSGFRACWAKYPLKYQVMSDAKTSNDGKFPSKAKTVYKCAGCGKHYPATYTYKGKSRRMVAVDHIIPAGGLTDWDDANQLIKSMFCSKENLQVLCDYPKILFDEMGKESCHYTKTQAERKAKKAKKS